ncbi:hypothetical protein Tco_0917456 [Tanacetum coccineum]
MPTEMELTLEQTQQGVSYEVSSEFIHMKLEILLEPTSNKLLVDFRYYDTTHLLEVSKSVEVKGISRKKMHIKAFQEWDEHVGPERRKSTMVQSFKWQRDWLLVDDLKMLKYYVKYKFSKELVNPEVNDLLTTYTHEKVNGTMLKGGLRIKACMARV